MTFVFAYKWNCFPKAPTAMSPKDIQPSYNPGINSWLYSIKCCWLWVVGCMLWIGGLASSIEAAHWWVTWHRWPMRTSYTCTAFVLVLSKTLQNFSIYLVGFVTGNPNNFFYISEDHFTTLAFSPTFGRRRSHPAEPFHSTVLPPFIKAKVSNQQNLIR